MAVATRPATSAAFAGRIRVLELLARFAKASTYCCATLRFAASRPPLPSIASATARTPAAVASAMTRISGASPFGHALTGIRENEARMSAIGYDVGRYKLAAFVLAGVHEG